MKRWNAFLALGLTAGCGSSSPTDDAPTCDDPTALSAADLRGDVTLAEGCYRVAASVSLTGAVTFEPGVIIQFDANAGIAVPSAASLNMAGTADKGVVLTGRIAERSYWRGIRFDSTNSPSNRLSHVRLEHAGSTRWTGADRSAGGVYVTGSSRVSLTNVAFEENGHAALNIDTTAVVAVENTSFRRNERAIAVNVQSLGSLVSGLTFDENDVEVITLYGGSTGTDTVTWSDHGIPYEADGAITVAGAITVEGGVEMAFPTNTGLSVSQDASLQVSGRADAPVVFRGIEATQGFWRGIRFDNTASPNNRLEHTVVDGGGSNGWTGATTSRGGVYVDGNNARLTIRNSTFRNSAYAGLNIDARTAIAVDASSFVGNERAILTRAPSLATLGESLTFENNGPYTVHVRGNTSLASDATLVPYSSPYYLTEAVSVEALLTLQPGVELVFDQGVGLSIKGDGRMSASGTASAQVVFRGREDVAGYWRGIGFSDSLSPTNRISDAVISGGGESGWTGSADSRANLYVERSSVALENVQFSKSGHHGVSVVTGGSITSCAGVTFEGIEQDDVFAVPAAVPSVACPL